MDFLGFSEGSIELKEKEMPITIQPKQPMLTAVSDAELEARKEAKILRIQSIKKAKDDARQSQLLKEREERQRQYEKDFSDREKIYIFEEKELKVISGDLDISLLREDDLSFEEKKEIIQFARICDKISLSVDNSAKIVAIVQQISKDSEWYKFPLIRAKVEFQRPGTSNITHKGIAPKYYRLVMVLLGSSTAGTDARVVKTTSF